MLHGFYKLLHRTEHKSLTLQPLVRTQYTTRVPVYTHAYVYLQSRIHDIPAALIH